MTSAAVANYPPISVIIATRNRASQISHAVTSVLSNDYPVFEVCVVDQSTDDSTARALANHLADPRLIYLRSEMRGVCRARNLAISRTRYELIASTDDDCVVPSDWLRRLVEAFTINPQIGLVFGNVFAPPHEHALWTVAAYERHAPQLICTMKDKVTARGIGACMGLRRSMWQAIGGFDESLGPGAIFRFGEELDIAIRCLLRGYLIYETPCYALVHHGLKPRAHARRLLRDAWYGIGAALAKYVKLGYLSVLPVLWYEWGVTTVLANLVRRRRPLGALQVIGFSEGFIAGLQTPVDRVSLTFVRA